MAGIDYKYCDVCNKRAFYDADLTYREATSMACTKEMGVKKDYKLGMVGDWVVLCDDCAPKYDIELRPVSIGD